MSDANNNAHHDKELTDMSVIKENEGEEATSSHQDISSSTVAVCVAKAPKSKDDRNVKRSRTFLMIILLSTALSIAGLVYWNVRQSENEAFVTQFETSAKQINHMINNKVKNTYLSIASMSALFPSAAHQSGATLPFITVPDFEAFGESALLQTHASLIAFSPLLQSSVQLKEWNVYAANHSNWVEEGRLFDSAIATIQESRGTMNGDQHEHLDDEGISVVEQFVYKVDSAGRILPESGEGPFAPLWEMTPVPKDTSAINFNLASHGLFAELLTYANASGKPILSVPFQAEQLFRNVALHDTVSPMSMLVQPVFDGFGHGQEHRVVGVLTAVISMVDFFTDVLPEGQRDMVVVADSCGTSNTFLIHGAEAEFVGAGDHHDRKYSSMEIRSVFVEFDAGDEIEHCHHILRVFPSSALEAGYVTNRPIHYAAFIVAMFLVTAIMFLIYDWLVGARQAHTELKADKANAIVSELFPKEIASQLFDKKAKGTDEGTEFAAGRGIFNGSDLANSSTIARLYPAATVLFADIAGFTAWSSLRGAEQVFLLLETVFRAFDMLAKKHGIYKVETIGDCYVAVCGVPKPKPDHAVQMLRFARSAQFKFLEAVKSLEMRLGVDTGDLGVRIGIHSGPVTAGVLRADRARFQLFGDTVNTASRMESSGQRGRVHLSEQTAAELVKYGKGDWIVPRDDIVELKGKGMVKTYWFKRSMENPAAAAYPSSVATSDSNDSDAYEVGWPEGKAVDVAKSGGPQRIQASIQRLVDWNCELLLQLLEPVAARDIDQSDVNKGSSDFIAVARQLGHSAMIIDEVVEIVEMPAVVRTAKTGKAPLDAQVVDQLHSMPAVVRTAKTGKAPLDAEVVDQLHSYIEKLASMYNDNPFHNFEHASHVVMSVNKLLARIVAPNQDDPMRGTESENRDKDLHDHTYGIKSDPLTHFTVVLAALIHDVDHPGVSNAQLIKEQPSLGIMYQSRSVAEQHSVSVAWNALLSPEYDQLRSVIFASEAELRRFRQLLVNSVIATDIFDKDLSAMRMNRWSKAFGAIEESSTIGSNRASKDRKATIVIEHLIQASDVAHTMQHWHVYLKWNQRLFNEMLRAYRDGRSDKNPSSGWYDGELWFFDNYIIPLANKLKECGVFGVSSDECLTYALQNRSEWAVKGQTMVETYLTEYEDTVQR